MVAVGHDDDVAAAHLGAHVDVVAGRGVDALEREALGVVLAGADLVVVDLLQDPLDLGVLVVLVGRVGGPVASGGQDLAGQQVGGLDVVAQGVVVDLARGGAGPPQAGADLGARAVAQRLVGGGLGAGKGDAGAVSAGEGHLGVAGDVDVVGDVGEDRLAPGHLEALTAGLDGAASRQGQDEVLVLTGGHGQGLPGGERHHAQGGPLPAGPLRGEVQLVAVVGELAGADDVAGLVRRLGLGGAVGVAHGGAPSAPGGTRGDCLVWGGPAGAD